MLTRATTEAPNKLYNLEIRQYEPNGNYIAGTGDAFGTVEIGEHLSVNLVERSDCQLVLVARGSGEAVGALGSNSLGKVQSMIIKSSVISAIDPSASGGINAMPYVLHLEHVKVAVIDGTPVIQSKEGNYDVRLLLRRLATRLTVNWDVAGELTTAGYALKEVKLCQVPADYRLLPVGEKTEWGITYPSAVAEFVDYYRLTNAELVNANGTKTVWIPANVRGISANATSPYYRTKENAPVAASYVELVMDNSQKKERLYYRAYLGGESSTDFNLYENTNYEWTIHINSANYQSDGRIQLLDQTPVVSTNIVNTSNCFMMKPGTNICFNPYKHTAKMNGYNQPLNGWNTYLTDGSTLAENKKITNVKVYWQGKDNGTSGDLVMGYAISKDNHTNLVRITDGDDLEKARIQVRVPISGGGNAVIAAYSGNAIVWSWHLWITNYVPQGITGTVTYEQAQQLTQNGSVHQYANSPAFQSGGNHANKVIMDRNLCATAGGFPGEKASLMEFAKRIGYLFYWGRKDPFFGSVDGTINEIDVIYDGEGYSLKLPKIPYTTDILMGGTNTMQYTIEHPMDIITGPLSWYNSNENSSDYQYLYHDVKTINDPCPAGWKTPYKTIYSQWNTNQAYWFDSDETFRATGSSHDRGGRLYNISGANGVPTPRTIHNTAWFPVTAFRAASSGDLAVVSGQLAGYEGTNTLEKNGNLYRIFYIKISNSVLTTSNNYSGYINEPYPFRCVQE